jgi:hypothetical protein
MDFFEKELPGSFGPNMREIITDEILRIFYENNRDVKSIKPGQVLWNAVHKDTRPDSKKRKFVPVVLTLTCKEDIELLENGTKMSLIRQRVISRIMREALEQGALLSTRDISLLLSSPHGGISQQRIKYEKENHSILPHTGSLQDMGTCLTHKYQIIYKYVVEKKDPMKIASETCHTQRAVDNYLKDFMRVKTLYFDGKDINYINVVTQLAHHVIKQYINIINQYVKERNIS